MLVLQSLDHPFVKLRSIFNYSTKIPLISVQGILLMQLGVGAMCNLKKNVSTCKMDEKCFICANYYEVYPTCKKNGGMIIVETYPTQVRRKRILVAG